MQPIEIRGVRSAQGKAVQIEPMKLKLKAPGTKRLKLQYDTLLSSFASNYILRRYIKAFLEGPGARKRAKECLEFVR
jgi:hypothetical protein